MPGLRKRRPSLVRAMLGALLLATAQAGAHEQDPDVARVRVSGETVYIVATPSVRAWAEFDDDHNGLLSKDEVALHREALLTAFEDAFRTDAARADGAPELGTKSAVFRDVSTPHAHGASQSAGAEHLRFTFRYRLERAPMALRVQWHRANLVELNVVAQRMSESMRIAEQRPLGPSESALLTPLRPGHVFFLAKPQRDTAAPPEPQPEREHEHEHAAGHEHVSAHSNDGEDHSHAPERHDGWLAKWLWVLTVVGALGAGLAFALVRARRKR